MNAARTLAVAAAHPAARPQTKSLWNHYRNARLWGKPVMWSIRYAREAQVKFG